jgi:hypothetical protein
MNPEWEVEPARGRCAETGRVFQQGEEFYTVLFENGESFRRVDYSPDAWQGPPEGCFCHFKSRVPVKEKRKKLLVDNEILVSFFTRLADQTDPLREQFRFVLALILMRKRLLRYDKSAKEQGREVWHMTLMTDRSEHRVANPRLTDEQIEAVSSQLGAILHGDMGEWAATADDLAGATAGDAS